MRLLPLILCLVATTAAADGSPLFSARTKALTTTESRSLGEIKGRPDVAEATAVELNAFALEGRVITLNVNGVERRFVGNKTIHPSGDAVWNGEDERGNSLMFSKGKNGHIDGSFQAGQEIYWFGQRGGVNFLAKRPQPPVDYVREDRSQPPKPAASAASGTRP